MSRPVFRKFIILFGVFLAIWLGIRYLLPLALPFLIGAGLALAADPLVRFCQNRLHLPRAAAAGIGVSVTLLLTVTLLVILAALLVRELSALAGIIPNLEDAARQGLSLLESWLLGMVSRTPDGIRSILNRTISDLFSGGSAFLDRFSQWLLGLASSVLKQLPDSALGVGTGIVASYMVSAKLPQIKTWLSQKLPQAWRGQYLPALQRLKNTLWCWLRAQFRLASVTFLILTAGFIALKIPYAPLWALIVALVDAAPLLGTGTILIPWSVVCLLQGNHIRSIGLLGTYAVAALTRSALEPRFVGRQLGIDPLLTLAALYAGYRIWGIPGMILSPLIAVTAVQLAESGFGFAQT